MKTIFTNSYFNKTFKSLLAFCVVLLMSINTFSQVTATESFEDETPIPVGAVGPYKKIFTQSGIKFNLTGRLRLYGTAGGTLGANGSSHFMDSGDGPTSPTIIGNIGSIAIDAINNPSTAFKVNSFAAYLGNSWDGNTNVGGTITFIGTKVDNTTVSATVAIPANASVQNGLNFTGTALDGVFLTSIAISLPSGVQYIEMDDFNFTTQAIVTNQFSINDVSQLEGNSGTSNFTFTITRTNNSAAGSVQVQSTNGTATAGSDYVAFPLTTVNFTAGGALTQTVNVTVNGDATIELDETFTMTISSPTGGVISDATGTGTILDDDASVETFETETNLATTFSEALVNFQSSGKFKVNTASGLGATNSNKYLASTTPFATGNQGAITVISSGKSINMLSVDLWTANVVGATYTPTTATVTFTGTKADGTGTVTHTASITPTNPSGTGHIRVSFAGTPFANVPILSISFSVSSAVNYLQVDNFTFSPQTISSTQVSINDVSILEGTLGGGNTSTVFTVTRTNNTSAFSVDVASSNGTATAGSDYTAVSTTLNFTNGGALTQTVNVLINKDATVEPNETFNMTLSNATSGSVYLKQVGIGTISNDDGGVGETFEDETATATIFTENSVAFSATGGYQVKNTTNAGSGSSANFLTSNNNVVGSMGTFSVTTPNTAFKIVSLDAWVGTSTTAFSTGPVTFTGTLFGGGTVTATKTITATSNTGTGWQQGITFTGTALNNVNLTAIQVSTGGSLKACDIDNFNFSVVNTLPIIEVVDASNIAITNGGVAATGNNTDFGGACVTVGTVSKTYTVKNLGQTNLTLSGSPLAVLGGADAGQFSVITQPTSPIAGAGSVTFTVQFAPSSVGVKNATITLTNNDITNSPYVINIKGTGNSTASPTVPTATPSSRTTAGSVTLSATGCAGGTLTWFNAADNVAVPSPNNQPNLMAAGTFNFYAKCTGTNTCVSVASVNVPVSVTLCTPLASSPGNVNITWTGLVSTDWNNACNWNPAWVPNATNDAVVIDLQTNQPTISGTVPTVNQIYINANATLTVSSGGTLNSNSTVVPITLQGGNIINNGTINVSGGGSSIGIYIGATANITNRGTITTNNLLGISLTFGNLTFTNESTGILNGDVKANGTNILTLTNRGTINYTSGLTFALNLNSVSSVVNTGTISVTGGNGISNPSGSSITNNACGKILMSEGEYTNGGTTTNAGLIQMPDAFNFTNTGTFTNNGVLKANTVASITNNKMVITNACPIFTLGGTNNYTVNGIFTEAFSAGTYTSVGNKFTANNTIATGSQILFAQVTDGTCTFVVPFGFNNVKPTAVSVNNTTICTGGSVTLLATCASGTPTWYTTATGGTSIGTGASLSNSPTVATTYYAACETANCASGRVATSAVTINTSLPTATATPITQTICSGGAITTIAITGTGTSYTWNRDNTTFATGIAASGSGNVSGSLTNTTEAPITVTFTITPVGTCNGTPITATVVVNPIPTVTASTPSQSICSGANITGITFNIPPPVTSLLPDPSSDIVPTAPKTAKGIVLSSFVAGTVFNWTRDNTATVTGGILGSGSGNISGFLNNTTALPVTVTFTITPSYTNAGKTCDGTPITVTVIVNPNPASAMITDAGTAFCSGSSTTLSAPADPNYTYKWERSLTGIANPNEFTTFGGTAQTQVITTSGVYRVIVTNQFNCSARDTTAVKFGDIVFSGSLGAGDLTQTGRMNRFAVASTCAAPKSYPGTNASPGAIFYDSYTVNNPTNAPVCATIGLTSGCGLNIFSAAYLGSFNPASVSTNYLADHGSSFSGTAFYEATIPANGTIVVVVHEVNTGTGCSGYNLRIDVPGATIAPTASSNAPICAGNTLNLTGTGTGSYAWAGPNGFTSSAQNPSIANVTTLATGTYTISVTNTNNCVFNATTAVTVNANPIATASSNSPVCGENSLNLTGGGGVSYLWSGPNSFTSSQQEPIIDNVSNSQTGTYTVTVTNSNGCTASTTVEVEINNPPTPIIPVGSATITICSNSSTQLTATGCSGSGLFLKWYDASDDSEVTLPVSPIVTSQYYATCERLNRDESVCSSPQSERVEVVVIAPPTPTPTGGTTICSAISTTLTATGCTGTNNVLKWFKTSDNSLVTMPVSPTVTTDYYAKCETTINSVTCLSPASGNVTVTVNRPATPNPTGASICLGNSVTLTATGCSGVGDVLRWFRAEFEGSPTLVTMPVSPTTDTRYVATCTATLNSVTCTSPFSSSVFVFVNTVTTPTITGATVCVGNTINLTSSVSDSYAWTGVNGFTSTDQNPSIQNATVSSSGTYRLTVSNISGCTATAQTTVTVNPNPTATASSSSPICVGTTLNLTGGGVGTYSWTSSNGFTSNVQSPTIPNTTVLVSGTYTITVTNISGCTSTASVSVTVNPVPTVTANSNSPICAGTTLNLTGGGIGTYLWTSSNGFTSTDQNPSIPSATASMSGTYTITVTNVNGCTATATTSVTVNPVVNPPTPQANTQIIFGASITLTATGCSGVNDVLKWYKSSDNSLAIMPVSPTVLTNFYAKCETTLNGITCISTNSVDVTVTVLSPNPPVATGATNCAGTPTTLTATGCSGSVGTFVLKWYQNADNALVTMPVSPLVSTDYYAKCEQTFNAVTAVSGKSNVVNLTILNPPTPVSTGGTIYSGQSISLTATGCSGTLGTYMLKWYQTADNLLVTMPVSPTVTMQYYSKCEQTANAITCLSAKSNDVTVTVVNRIFVDITKIAAPIQNGNSWATAYGNLQTGLAAATAGVEVWVAKGMYKPTNTVTRTIYFNIPNNVKVYGGFAGTEDNLIDRDFRTNVTVLSGDIGTQKLAADNSYHVVVLNGSSNITVLDGFTIVDGYANFDPNRTYFAPDALAPTTGTIETGGGILVQNAGMPTIANCTIIQNSAVTGGGLYAGDASMPTIIGCKFMANQAGFGAGMYFQDGSNGKVDNTLISGNRGVGGVYNNNSSPMFTNVTFAGNGGYNGGIFNSNSTPVIKNSIIWGNSTPFNDTQSIVTYSTIQGGYAGIGNLSMDPKFVSLTPEGLSPSISGDYHLQASSLAIDRGDNGTISLIDKDLDGNLRRFSGGRVDMGAYEFQGTATATLVISVATGNWEINSTWDIGRVPQLGDYVIIDNNHIVTLSTTGIVKNLEYRGTGKLKFNTTISKLEIGF